jgi:hypothetical protein
MKNTLILFSLLAFLMPLNSGAQNEGSEIMKVLMDQQAAWNAGYLEQFMGGYWKSDSLSFIGKKGVNTGWQQTLDNYRKSYPDKATMGELNFEILKIDVLSPESAYVIGKWKLKRSPEKGDLSGHFTLLFKKMKNAWVIVSDHSS